RWSASACRPTALARSWPPPCDRCCPIQPPRSAPCCRNTSASTANCAATPEPTPPKRLPNSCKPLSLRERHRREGRPMTLLIAGVAEAGRGPLARPDAVAAVILDPARPIDGLDDSKKLNGARCEALFPLIQQCALAWHVELVTR